MFCYLCGKEVDDTAERCPYCGVKLKEDEPSEAAPETNAKTEEKDEFFDPAPAPASAPTPAPTVTTTTTQVSSNTPKQSNGMALAGFILSFFMPVLGLIFSIIGLVRSKNGYDRKGLAIAGLIISAIGLVISVIVFYTSFMTAFNGALNGNYTY